MEFTTWSLVAIPLALLAFFALLWSLVVLFRNSVPSQPFTESLLAASVICVLALNAEVYALSLLPLERPLDWLPLAHSVGVILLIGWTLLRYGQQGWRLSFQDVSASARAVWQQPLTIRALVLCTLFIILITIAYGMYTVQTIWDGLEYHVPMAIQPYQDGRIGDVPSNLQWAGTYPRGEELISYWTLQWTGTSVLFTPVQVAFGVQLLLASYVLARRTGIQRWAVLLALAVIGTMPLFFITTTADYNDIGYAAGIVALLAFLAPVPGGRMRRPFDWLLVVAAFSQSTLIKLPIVATLFGGIAMLHVLLFSGPIRTTLQQLWRFARSWYGLLAMVMLIFSANSYIKNVIVYKNPLYPLNIAIAGRQVFSGSLDSSQLSMGAKTLMGNVSDMTIFQRYYAAWADLFNPLNIDGFGSPGPLFLLVVLFCFVLFAGYALSRRQSWLITLVVIFFAGFLVPGFYMPRYSISMLVVGVIGASWTFQQLPADLLPGLKLFLVAGSIYGMLVSAGYMYGYLRWTTALAGNEFSLANRTAFVAEKVQLGVGEWFASPEMTRYIRDNSGPGDILAWNVRTFHALLWNRTYSNKVVFLPGSPNDFYPRGAHYLDPVTQEELQGWVVKLKQLNPKHVLLYTQSGYAQYLLAHPELGYQIGYQDPASRGKGALIIFERRNS